MNRSLANVIFGGVGAASDGRRGSNIYAGRVKSASQEVAMLMIRAPGCGHAWHLAFPR
jgi:NAD(P) transhydrogenase subunit beta